MLNECKVLTHVTFSNKQQPNLSEAEGNAQSLVSSSSPTFRDAVAVTAGALGTGVLIGTLWELFRKRRKIGTTGRTSILAVKHSNFS